MKSQIKNLLILAVFAFFYFLPFVINHDLLLAQDNDLQQQFWPFFYFIQQKFWETHTLPLWNNLIFSGTPLLPDPQFSLFYPPNFLFIILPTNLAFLVYLFFHIILGGIGIYLISLYIFHWPALISLSLGAFYIFAPRLAGYLEAGHSGLVASYGFLPLVLLAILGLNQQGRIIWVYLLTISLTAIFFTHTVTFGWVLLISTFLWIILVTKTRYWLKKTIYFTVGILLVLGLSAVTLLPQLQWAPITSRNLLLVQKDIYPKWESKKEFLAQFFLPYQQDQKDTEKTITLGVGLLILALLGWWNLSLKNKILTGTGLILAGLIALNNVSPVYPILLSQDIFVLTRVTTRHWFAVIMLVIFLAGFGLKILLSNKVRPLIIITILFLIGTELIFLSWSRLLQIDHQSSQYAPGEIYQFLQQDPSRYRVFCLTRCLAQQDAALHQLELVEGYNTLQQMNYYQHMWQLSGGYWNYYTLALPPIGLYKFTRLIPDPVSLGEYNTKYIISPYPLDNPQLRLAKKINQFFIYQNQAVLPRAYFKNSLPANLKAPILKFSPNEIRIDTSSKPSNQLVLAEVYSPGWQAYLNGKEKTPVLETPISLRLVSLKSDTQFVDFKYQPPGFKEGSAITLVTILIMAGAPFLIKKMNRSKKR